MYTSYYDIGNNVISPKKYLSSIGVLKGGESHRVYTPSPFAVLLLFFLTNSYYICKGYEYSFFHRII